MLGVRPFAGRGFLAEEGQPGAPKVAFPAEGVLTASITLPALKYPNPEQRIGF